MLHLKFDENEIKKKIVKKPRFLQPANFCPWFAKKKL
jgi:hypothetical protein